MRAQVVGDLVVGIGIGAADGVDIPEALESLPVGRLRVLNGAVVDAAGYGQFYVDDTGRKHLAQGEPGWPLVVCGWDTQLVMDGGWRVRSAADDLAASKAAKRTELRTLAQAAIEAGVESAALGAAHTYPTTLTDQHNLTGLVAAGLVDGLAAKFWCADGSGVWARREHTWAQLQVVARDVKAHVIAQQDRYENRLAQVAAAADLPAVAAVGW